MILDTQARSGLYHGLHPRFAAAFAWLATGAWKSMEAGKYDIQGKDVWVNLVRGETKVADEVKWEAHRAYADIQCVLEGEDRMWWAPLAGCTLGDYDGAKDFQALQPGEVRGFVVAAGEFAVFFPSDAHRPGTCPKAPAPYVKAVLKVRVDDIGLGL